ncbi:unnamed protein product [Microthlaspi erraticum]|uniref:Disease resistance protein Roq1-like winged-helix domain-containing protein n=1 Tax=Microthlaspi erraticum TaxID=1685480 RepID=A0A6D2HK30_9BRAS|nr:unnamed protein product [Microthlaspi erraticum]
MKVDHLGAVKERLHDQRVLIILDDVDDLGKLEVLGKEICWFGNGSRIIVTTEDNKILKAHGMGLKISTMIKDRLIKNVLRVGYDRLLIKDQALFLHITCFFNKNRVDRVTSMLADSNLDVENGLNTLAVKSLVHIDYDYMDTQGSLMMHRLLQQMGRQVVLEQSNEPGKHQLLLEAEEICDVLANETGTGSVIGNSFDMSKIGEFSMRGRVLEGMRNLRFFRLHNGKACLLNPECLVELNMESSNLKKLWEGIQPLTNLKEMNLSDSCRLKEIPNLSKATNLETLTLNFAQVWWSFPHLLGIYRN